MYVEIEHALSIFDVTQASSLHEFSIRVLSQPRPPSAIWLHNLLISASHIPNTDDKYKFYKKNISKNLKLQISLKLTQNTKKKHQWSLKYDHMTTIMMMEKKKKRQIVVRKVSCVGLLLPTDRVEVPIHLRWKLTHLAKKQQLHWQQHQQQQRNIIIGRTLIQPPRMTIWNE